jgi:hypothetical protein
MKKALVEPCVNSCATTAILRAIVESIALPENYIIPNGISQSTHRPRRLLALSVWMRT